MVIRKMHVKMKGYNADDDVFFFVFFFVLVQYTFIPLTNFVFTSQIQQNVAEYAQWVHRFGP